MKISWNLVLGGKLTISKEQVLGLFLFLIQSEINISQWNSHSLTEAPDFRMSAAALPNLQCKKKVSYIMIYNSLYDQQGAS